MPTEQKTRACIAAAARSALLTLLVLSASASYSQTDVRDADPGSLVLVHVQGRFPANFGQTLEILRLSISGHLVDVP